MRFLSHRVDVTLRCTCDSGSVLTFCGLFDIPTQLSNCKQHTGDIGGGGIGEELTEFGRERAELPGRYRRQERGTVGLGQT